LTQQLSHKHHKISPFAKFRYPKKRCVRSKPDVLSWITDYRGEIAALSAAFCWTLSSVIYGRIGPQMPPLQLNFIKGVISISGIVITFWLQGTWIPEIPARSLFLLSMSGIIGIGLGDTAFFNTLNRLGPRRTLLVQTLAPPLAAVLAVAFLSESLAGRAWIGIALILLGVAWVISDRVSEIPTERQQIGEGLLWGFVSAFCQAGGAVLSRAALADTVASPLSAAFVRLVSGLVVILLWMWILPAARQTPWKPVPSARLWGALGLAAFVGTYLAIWLQQTSLKFAPAGISQTLSATSPLFVLPIAARAGEKIGIRAVLGALAAVVGVALLFN